jgi:hypothetical protein
MANRLTNKTVAHYLRCRGMRHGGSVSGNGLY